MTKRPYCTYVDHRYLPRALALIDSIRSHGCRDEIWVCCLSPEAREGLTAVALPGVIAVDIAELEREYPRLVEVKKDRTVLEYYFTCSPLLIEYIFRKSPDAETVTYLDSDLFFFGDPERVHREIGEAPVAIIPHNLTRSQKWREKYGHYNVGWVSFRRSEEGLACLTWWKERCLEWCYTRVEDGRYADQGYLDSFPQVAPHTRILTNKGFNTAPWNIGNYRIRSDGRDVFLDDEPLVFFHFHGVRRGFRYFYFGNHRRYRAPFSFVTRNRIYRPYIARLLLAEAALQEKLPAGGGNAVLPRGRLLLGYDVRNALRVARITLDQLMDLLQGRPIFVWSGKAY